MSDIPHGNHHKLQHEHTTMASYVIGFILSLIFTLIPYYMVSHHTASSTLLLAAILGFAVTQMVIQILFFLHLGRGPKPRWNLYFFAATVGIILVVVGGSIVIINNLHYNKMPSDQVKLLVDGEAIAQIGGKKTGACEGQHTNHIVTIKNDKVAPLHTDAQRCDTLTFSNQDGQVIDMAFGEHPRHDAYAGQSEYIIRSGSNKTITLSEVGSYKFHNHLNEETAGNFTVAQ